MKTQVRRDREGGPGRGYLAEVDGVPDRSLDGSASLCVICGQVLPSPCTSRLDCLGSRSIHSL